MLSAPDAQDSSILAVVLVQEGFVHQPRHVTDPARICGSEPGFAEDSRAMLVATVRESVTSRP